MPSNTATPKETNAGGNESVDAEPGGKGWQKWMVTEVDGHRRMPSDTDRWPEVLKGNDTSLQRRGVTSSSHAWVNRPSFTVETDTLIDASWWQAAPSHSTTDKALHLAKISNLDLIKPLTPTSSLLKTQTLVEQLKWLHEKAMRQTQIAGYSEGQLTCLILFFQTAGRKRKGRLFYIGDEQKTDYGAAACFL